MKRGLILILGAAGFVCGGCVADGGYYEGDVGVYGPVVEPVGWYGRPWYHDDAVIVRPGFDHRDDRRGPAPGLRPAAHAPGIPSGHRPSGGGERKR